MNMLGIDIGGSGVKGAIVDTTCGTLLTPVAKVPTPQRLRPDELCMVVDSIVRRFKWNEAIGVGIPGILREGVIRATANLHPDFRGLNFEHLLKKSLGAHVSLLNDADAAGLAEAAFGAGKEIAGSVLVLTFGTGVGSALVFNQRLCPHTEFGQFPIRGKPAEYFVSASAKTRRKLGYPEWAREVNGYLKILERVLQPDLIIAGGGISADHEHWFQYLDLATPVLPAAFRNEAGIVGAALFAAKQPATGASDKTAAGGSRASRCRKAVADG
jgi:polyphosphate glucokinase